MKVTYRGLNQFFDGKLPQAEYIAKALTFHAWEIEGMEEKEGTTVLEVKVLPDKTPWALSHRGIAKDLSVVLDIPLSYDPFLVEPTLEPKTDAVKISLKTETCDRYSAVYIKGVTVRPSPQWLQSDLRALGQRPINNIVDIMNYVMLGIGQPLHAFDAQKLSGGGIGVRKAKAGEKIVVLTGETYTLSSEDTIIVDSGTDEPIAIAGVKGGKHAEIDAMTTDIIIESAHFDPVSIRKTSQRLGLRTDASSRFENRIVPELAGYGIRDAVKYIIECVEDFGGGTLVGYVDTGIAKRIPQTVSVPLSQLNSMLGLALETVDVEKILQRFGYEFQWEDTTLIVIIPFERTDLNISEDIIEEIGRIYGYEHVASIEPKEFVAPEINTSFFYIHRLRHALVRAGFSEIYTSSFRAHDEMKLKNAFASDKGYLRSGLFKNMDEALAKNIGHTYLLGQNEICAFEIGTVFSRDGERLNIVIGVRGPGGFKPKMHELILSRGIAAVESIVGMGLHWKKENGIAESSLTPLSSVLPTPISYDPIETKGAVMYVPFSSYPSVARDIALFVPEESEAKDVERVLNSVAGPLRVRTTLFDEFQKEGKKSFAFRLVFQSYERTLTDAEVNAIMDEVYEAARTHQFEVR